MGNPKSSKKTSEDILSLYNQAPQQGGVYNMGLIGSPGGGGSGVNSKSRSNFSDVNHNNANMRTGAMSAANMQLVQQQHFMMMQQQMHQMQLQQQMGMMSPMQMQMMNGGGMMVSPQQLQFQQMQ